MRKKKKLLWRLIQGVILCTMLCLGFSCEKQVYAKESSDLMENVEEENGEYVHPEGDVTLSADYTLPENTY